MLLLRGVYYQAARRWPHMFDLCPLWGLHSAYGSRLPICAATSKVSMKQRMHPAKNHGRRYVDKAADLGDIQAGNERLGRSF